MSASNPSDLSDQQYDLDPVNCLVAEQGYSAILIETEKEHLEEIHRTYAGRNNVQRRSGLGSIDPAILLTLSTRNARVVKKGRVSLKCRLKHSQ